MNKTLEILDHSQPLKDKKIVITAGGTIEKLDPVRYISNFSSGKMGTALADNAYMMGADVELISTFDIERPYKVTKVLSALDMLDAVLKSKENSDCVIMSAAVADYRAENYAEQKIKKTSDDKMTVNLIKNPDILKTISENKGDTKIVGVCAESENLLKNAKIKIKNKGCDYLVANDISRKDIGFSSDENEVYILSENKTKHLKKASKNKIAKQILEYVFCE